MASVSLFVVELVALAVVVAVLFARYASVRRTPLHVLVTTCLGWWLAFSVVAILPFDVSATFEHRCLAARRAAARNDTAHEQQSRYGDCHAATSATVSPDALFSIWSVVYWLTFWLTWFIIPLQQSFETSGEFTVRARLRAALRENAIIYAVLGVLFGAFLLYIAYTRGLDDTSLSAFAVSLANAFGLFMLICLLGHGLVEVPRSLWVRSRVELGQKHCQFMAVELTEKLTEAQLSLKGTLSDLGVAHEALPRTSPLRRQLEIILAKCTTPLEDLEVLAVGRAGADEPVTAETLVRLHRRLMRDQAAVLRQECLWHQLVLRSIEHEDVLSNAESPERRWVSTIRGATGGTRGRLQWLWRVRVAPRAAQAAAALLALVSVTLVWSEATFSSTRPNLSLYAWMVHLRGTSDVGVQVMCLLPLAYICACATSSLFKVQLFDYFRLVPHQHTDSNSLLFSSALICRMIAPIAYNFLMIIHEGRDPAFARLMGPMDLVPVLGEGFNTYFPMLLVLLVLLNALNGFGKCMNALNMPRFVFEADFDDEALDEGAALLAIARRKHEGAVRRAEAKHERLPRGFDDFLGLDSTLGDLEAERIQAQDEATRRRRDSAVERERAAAAAAAGGGAGGGVRGWFARVFGGRAAGRADDKRELLAGDDDDDGGGGGVNDDDGADRVVVVGAAAAAGTGPGSSSSSLSTEPGVGRHARPPPRRNQPRGLTTFDDDL